MGKYDKAYIYFDTNALECRHSGKALFLSQFTVNSLYFEIEDLIRNMKLMDRVEICIPEIVWYELQEHLVSYFKSEKASMESKISSFRKSFGNLAEITCEFKECNTESEYTTYASSIAQGFLENPRVNANIVSCCKDENAIQQIIGQAVHSIKPFRMVKANGKEYTDAGFKDALIFNTLIEYTGSQLGILISNDNDFSELFNETTRANLKLCRDAKELQVILSDEFNVISTDIVESILTTDKYLILRILSDCGIEEDVELYCMQIQSCKMVEDDVFVHFTAMIHETNYSFEIIYNINANELIEASCEVFEESEEE